MTASFPIAVPTTPDLRGDIADNIANFLSADINASVTTIPVDDTTGFPSAGVASIQRIGGTGLIEVFSYTGKTANSFTGVTRNFNGAGADPYSEDDIVHLYWVADHHNRHVEETIAVAQNVTNRFGLGTNIVVPAGLTFAIQRTSNQLVFGTTNTITLNMAVPSASRVYTAPDVGGDADFILTAGAQEISGAKTFQSSKLLLQEASGVDVATIAVAALAASRIYTVPDSGAAASFVMTEGNQTINGTKTFTGLSFVNLDLGSSGVAGSLDIFPTTAVKGKLNFVAADSAGDTITTITNASQAGARTYTIPDAGASASFVMTAGAQSIAGIKTFTGQLIGKGTATNDSPAAGDIGEVIESYQARINLPATGVFGDLTSIALTAGNWVIDMVADCNCPATVTEFDFGISTTAGDDSTGLLIGDSLVSPRRTYAVGNRDAYAIPGFEVKLAGSTTYFLKYRAAYGSTAPQSSGRLTATRIR
ncbi:hypothetical protein LCGC14_0901030 [marine sediment metagenome]|uniref:Uncharacterized protein n=1 Tax=marine sediment metagenome TaxID=412755 RepID=A0A0F9P1D2_9ZZZZ